MPMMSRPLRSIVVTREGLPLQEMPAQLHTLKLLFHVRRAPCGSDFMYLDLKVRSVSVSVEMSRELPIQHQQKRRRRRSTERCR